MPPTTPTTTELETYLLACNALEIKPLPSVLQTLTHTHTDLHLEEGLSEIELCAVALMLSKSKLIHTVTLTKAFPGAEGMRQLGIALAENDVVHTLMFSDTDLSVGAAAGGNKEGEEEGEKRSLLSLFTTELKQNLASSALKHLSFRGCSLSVGDVKELVECLIHLPALGEEGTLDLSHNALPPETSLVLGKLLRAHNGPTTLILAHNNLEDYGAAALGGAFAADLSPPIQTHTHTNTHTNTHTRTRTLSSVIGADGCLKHDFARPWGLNVVKLDLSYNDIGDEGLAELVRGIRVYSQRHTHL